MEQSNMFNKKKKEMKIEYNEGLARARSIIYYILSIIEVLLAFRFLFKLLGANPESPVVAFLYGITRILLFPFTGIFRSLITGTDGTQLVFEPEIIIAAVVYALIARGIVKLIEIIFFSENLEKI